MDSGQLLTLAKEYGPGAFSVVGSVLAFLFSTFWAAVIWAWRKHKAHMETLENLIHSLKEHVDHDREQNASEHLFIKESMAAFRAEVHLLELQVNPLKAGLLTLEGAVRNQNETINRYVEKMGVVSGKLDAVFRFIDAVPRPTDNK